MTEKTSPSSDTSLEVRRLIKADPKTVFSAWTEAEMVRKWWGPGAVTCPKASLDLRIGGAIRIANKLEDGSIIWIVGAFELIEPPSRLIYSWRMGESTGDDSRVTVLFNAHPMGTELVLLHERFANSATRDAHLGGWNGCLDGLEQLFGL